MPFQWEEIEKRNNQQMLQQKVFLQKLQSVGVLCILDGNITKNNNLTYNI